MPRVLHYRACCAKRGDVELLLDQAGVEALAARVGSVLVAGDVVLLRGGLGAGKTTFARALIRAVCGDVGLEVPSPSYTLVQSYEAGRVVIHHFDLWRLDGPEGLAELGWDAALEDVVVVEWPERVGLAGALEVGFEGVGEVRRVSLGEGWGKKGLLF